MSGVPGSGVKGARGCERGGGAEGKSTVLVGEKLTPNAFNASWAARGKHHK